MKPTTVNSKFWSDKFFWHAGNKFHDNTDDSKNEGTSPSNGGIYELFSLLFHIPLERKKISAKHLIYIYI